MSTPETMRVNRAMAFADPKRARKLARAVKGQAELRLRLTKAIEASHAGGSALNVIEDIDAVVDAVIEELKK